MLKGPQASSEMKMVSPFNLDEPFPFCSHKRYETTRRWSPDLAPWSCVISCCPCTDIGSPAHGQLSPKDSHFDPGPPTRPTYELLWDFIWRPGPGRSPASFL